MSNALRAQSQRHPHGWGIGWYDAAGLHVRRSIIAAHADAAFVEAAGIASARVVVAHVRDASVGAVAPENTHPFAHGRWLLAHNGTVARFAQVEAVRAELEAEIDPGLRGALRGETDSERCLLLFLSRLGALLRPGLRPGLPEARRALAQTLAVVTAIADAPGERPSSLNLVVTDGELLAACRRGRTLHLAERPHEGGFLALASEPIGAGPWRELPEGGFAGIDGERRLVEGALDEAASRAA